LDHTFKEFHSSYHNREAKVKGKAVPVLNEVPRHEDAWRSGDIAPLIRSLYTG